MVWGIDKYDEERSRVKFVCLKSRDRHPTPKPFIIEGLPWISKRRISVMFVSAARKKLNAAIEAATITGCEQKH
jgi:hypothetical protein